LKTTKLLQRCCANLSNFFPNVLAISHETVEPVRVPQQPLWHTPGYMYINFAHFIACWHLSPVAVYREAQVRQHRLSSAADDTCQRQKATHIFIQVQSTPHTNYGGRCGCQDGQRPISQQFIDKRHMALPTLANPGVWTVTGEQRVASQVLSSPVKQKEAADLELTYRQDHR